jgi:hypothetical protein
MGEGVDNVALGDNPIDPLAIVAGDESADIAGDQRVNRRADCIVGSDCRYRTSLVVQDCFDVHLGPLRTLARLPERPL